MRLFGTIQIWLLLAVSSMSSCHLLVAGNEDAFRSLAKNFVPQKLADQLAKLVSQASEATILEGEDYAGPKVEYENQNYDKEKEYEVADDDQLSFRIHPQAKPVARQSVMRKPKMEVNLDELVEKVRARLLDELKTSSVGPLNDESPRSMPNRRPPDQNYKNQDNEDYAAAIDDPQPFKKKKQTNHNKDAGQAESHSQKPEFQINKGPKHVSLMQPLKSTRKDKPGVVIESHDLFDKVKLTKKKSKKDSYEDYIMNVPKNKGDVFDSEEDPGLAKQNDRPFTKRQGRSSFRTRLTTRNNNYNDENKDNNKFNNNNMNRKLTRKTRPTPQDTDMFSKMNFDNNDMNGPMNKLRTTSDRSVTTTEEYVDDIFHTTATNTDIEPKAATEFLGGDWNDETPKDFQTTTEEVVMYPRKKTPKRIVTNMQIRQRYTINTPNYYDKLPRIAEKYNFDEPIPEKDREEENLKPMFKPPHNINGKVKV